MTAVVVGNQDSKQQGFADPQHLNYTNLSVTCNPMTRINAAHHQQTKEHTPANPRTDNINKYSQLPTLSLNILANTCKFCPLTPERFHVLLNSLFKVLFNFPSRYLFAIGLVVIFSLRWSLPPYLGCTPKQPDSTDETHCTLQLTYGPSTLHGRWPRSRGT
jgi:hypothetical protein